MILLGMLTVRLIACKPLSFDTCNLWRLQLARDWGRPDLWERDWILAGHKNVNWSVRNLMVRFERFSPYLYLNSSYLVISSLLSH